jgi:hypothetical protein
LSIINHTNTMAASRKNTRGKDVVTAPGGAVVEVWKTVPKPVGTIPGWVKWAVFGLITVGMAVVLSLLTRKPSKTLSNSTLGKIAGA